MNRSTMMTYLALFLGTWVGSGHAQTQEHPPVEQYLMPQADEIALAKTAAPANISGRFPLTSCSGRRRGLPAP